MKPHNCLRGMEALLQLQNSVGWDRIPMPAGQLGWLNQGALGSSERPWLRLPSGERLRETPVNLWPPHALAPSYIAPTHMWSCIHINTHTTHRYVCQKEGKEKHSLSSFWCFSEMPKNVLNEYWWGAGETALWVKAPAAQGWELSWNPNPRKGGRGTLTLPHVWAVACKSLCTRTRNNNGILKF